MSAQEFLKKPVRVWAHPYNGANSTEVVAWADSEAVFTIPDGPDADLRRPDGLLLFIDTLEGQLYATPGDWIIRGIAGEFYPCKSEIFDATYDPVKD